VVFFWGKTAWKNFSFPIKILPIIIKVTKFGCDFELKKHLQFVFRMGSIEKKVLNLFWKRLTKKRKI
jgi:hypothetical protein